MPGPWTDERRARAAETALRVKPWLKSTGPKTPQGKAASAKRGFKGAVRPTIRAIRRKTKAMMAALDNMELQGLTLHKDEYIANELKALGDPYLLVDEP